MADPLIKLNVRVDQSLKDRLQAIADESHLRLSDIARLALWKLCEERANGKKKTKA